MNIEQVKIENKALIEVVKELPLLENEKNHLIVGDDDPVKLQKTLLGLRNKYYYGTGNKRPFKEESLEEEISRVFNCIRKRFQDSPESFNQSMILFLKSFNNYEGLLSKLPRRTIHKLYEIRAAVL